MTHIEALKLALEALELLSQQPTDSALDYADNAITAIKAALAQPAQEPVNLRRGDRLRCIETDELCFVWATSTTGKTLIKWSANNFGNYTAEQIGELFWMEPAQQEPQVCCGEYDTCLRACTPRGRHLAQPAQRPRNFCPRCGKRTQDIHTCTPPQELNT